MSTNPKSQHAGYKALHFVTLNILADGSPSVEKLHLEKEHDELYETVLDSESGEYGSVLAFRRGLASLQVTESRIHLPALRKLSSSAILRPMHRNTG